VGNSQKNKLINFYNKCKDKKHFNWLNGRSYSEALVICVGAGPWRFNRRKKIQGLALSVLNGRDLTEFPLNVYPLDWQNNIIINMQANTLKNRTQFNIVCQNINHRNAILEMSGCKKLPKVLSLFCRDSLKIPAFPIDRHVKRKLEELNLPTNEDDMINLCIETGLPPRDVAVAFVRVASDMDNPDWSIG